MDRQDGFRIVKLSIVRLDEMSWQGRCRFRQDARRFQSLYEITKRKIDAFEETLLIKKHDLRYDLDLMLARVFGWENGS